MVDPYGGKRAMVLNAGNRTYETEYELASEFEGEDVGGGNIASATPHAPTGHA
jgi:hypothetical protein